MTEMTTEEWKALSTEEQDAIIEAEIEAEDLAELREIEAEKKAHDEEMEWLCKHENTSFDGYWDEFTESDLSC